MSLKIKLTRIGRKNEPKYRLVIAEEHSKRDGKYLEKIGFYDPVAAKPVLDVNKDRLQYWLSVGARFTKGTYRLLKSHI
jgi:small subunit ribosomal protein S16